MGIIIINVIGAVIALVGAILHAIKCNFKWAIILTLCFCLNVILFIDNLDESYYQNDNDMSKPTAKDVYEGKTTLRIVYEDSIPVDTIVVFKKEFR